MLLRFTTLTASLFAYTLACAQQNNSLFFIHRIPQSNLINPAFQIDCPIYVGVPFLSSLHFNLFWGCKQKKKKRVFQHQAVAVACGLGTWTKS